MSQVNFMQVGMGIGIITKQDREESEEKVECSSMHCSNRPLFEITGVGQRIYLCDKCLQFIIENGEKISDNFRKGVYDSIMF